MSKKVLLFVETREGIFGPYATFDGIESDYADGDGTEIVYEAHRIGTIEPSARIVLDTEDC